MKGIEKLDVLSKKQTAKSIGRVACGCFAVKHPFIGSCNQCGRIMCDFEGMGPCFNCNSEFVAPMTAEDAENLGLDDKTIMAYKHKDKLLMFDKENAKRTHVFDAQADYYETGTWLTEEEKRNIQIRERKRREDMKKSNRMKFMAYDINEK